MSQSAEQRIRFACQQCDQLLSIGASKVGRTVKCPQCEHVNKVPTLEEAKQQIAARKQRKAAQREAIQESSQDFSQFTVFDQDNEFIFEQDEEGGGYYFDKNIDHTKLAVSRRIVYAQGVLLGVVAIGMFAFGWFVGSATSTPKASPEEDLTPRVVRGTLHFKDSSGRDQPDAGSVVIMVPEESRPGQNDKVDIDGLRPDDPPPDETHPALQRIAVMGGAYARTDANGEYRLQLPKRGKYFLLIISGNTYRSGASDLNKEHLAQMGRYFIRATELLGDNRFRWSEERIGQDVRRDFVFGET
jgi:phage FluMu protein Com